MNFNRNDIFLLIVLVLLVQLFIETISRSGFVMFSSALHGNVPAIIAVVIFVCTIICIIQGIIKVIEGYFSEIPAEIVSATKGAGWSIALVCFTLTAYVVMIRVYEL